MKQVEIMILSGFLGSGKTTLLQNFLEEEKKQGRKAAVLMNEIGEFSVDSNLLAEGTKLKELTNGCICCTAKDELERNLLSLYQMYEPDIIYIEATGIAHPVEVLDICLSPVIAPHIIIRSIITTVDAERWTKLDGLTPQIKRLFHEQVRHADIVLVNKTDLVSEDALLQVEDMIKGINKEAQIIRTNYSNISLAEIGYSNRTEAIEHDSLHARKQLQIQSLTYTFTKPISKENFENWLRVLPDTVHRVKGFLRLHEDDGKTTLLQYAYGLPQYTIQDLAYKNHLVVIGENLNKKELTEQLEALE